jgi:replicative DNA helicase
MNEVKIIGNILKSPKKRKEALELLRPEYFANQEIGKIYQLCETIEKEEGLKKYSIDVFFELGRKYDIDVDMITATQSKDVETYDVKEWYVVLATLIESYRSRTLADECMLVAQRVNSRELSSTKGLQEIKNLIDKVSIESAESSLNESSDLIANALERVRDRMNSTGLSGTATGFSQLDELLDGYQKGDLMILAGRPAMGKTAFAIQKCINTVKSGGKAIFFSLEMPKEQIMQRIISAESKVELGKIKKGQLHSYELERIEQKTKWLSSNNKFYIDDRSGITVDQIRATVQRANKNKDLNFIVIDYLQLIKPSTNYRGNRNNEIGEITRSLKVLAKEEGITIALLSQLSRQVEQREGKVPQMSDLRDSGEIEQDADIIGFCYRPEYYDIMQDADGNSTKGLFMYLIKKNRSGELKNLEFNCNLAIQKIWEGDDTEIIEPIKQKSVFDFPQNTNLEKPF